MDQGKWIADSITTYAVPVSGHSKRSPARNPSDVAPRGLASTWACTAAKALCVMKIGYGEFVGAPSTVGVQRIAEPTGNGRLSSRSEEHTSELQSQSNLVCRLLLEKKTHSHSTPGVPNEECHFVACPPP